MKLCCSSNRHGVIVFPTPTSEHQVAKTFATMHDPLNTGTEIEAKTTRGVMRYHTRSLTGYDDASQMFSDVLRQYFYDCLVGGTSDLLASNPFVHSTHHHGHQYLAKASTILASWGGRVFQ